MRVRCAPITGSHLASPEMQSGTWYHVGGVVIGVLPTPGEFFLMATSSWAALPWDPRRSLAFAPGEIWRCGNLGLLWGSLGPTNGPLSIQPMQGANRCQGPWAKMCVTAFHRKARAGRSCHAELLHGDVRGERRAPPQRAACRAGHYHPSSASQPDHRASFRFGRHGFPPCSARCCLRCCLAASALAGSCHLTWSSRDSALHRCGASRFPRMSWWGRCRSFFPSGVVSIAAKAESGSCRI